MAKQLPDDQQDRGTKLLIDALLLKPQSFGREEMLARTRKLRYHDYKSDDALNSVTLVKHLKGAGFHDLSQRAADGEFDQQKDASDEWAQTPDGKRMTEMVEKDPKLKAKMKATMEKLGQAQKDGRLKVTIPDDGPPEPGTKGQA